MLIAERSTTREQSGMKSLSKPCPYCTFAEASYPLMLSNVAGLFVYHAAYATENLIDLYTPLAITTFVCLASAFRHT